LSTDSFITDNLEKAQLSNLTSILKEKLSYKSAVLLSGKILKLKIPLAIPSIMFQTKRKPRANADRFTSMPKTNKRRKSQLI
jgi:hypothetical protein